MQMGLHVRRGAFSQDPGQRRPSISPGIWGPRAPESEAPSLHYFGTDGLRGPLTSPQLQPAFFQKLGWALGSWLQEQGRPSTLCLMAWDTRASGPRLGQALAQGLGRLGYTVQTLGIAPSAALACTSVYAGAAVGLMITASHNPHTDNGVKLIGANGHKLTQKQEARIEALLSQAPDVFSETTPQPYPEGLDPYLRSLKALASDLDLSKLPCVVDCAHGAASGLAPYVLKHYNWKGLLIGNTPNGLNINKNVGSEHPEHLREAVCGHAAPLGLAFDGDADRLLVCGPDGSVIEGEALLGLLAKHLTPQGKCVTTHYSNQGLDTYLSQQGIDGIRVDVGDRNVAQAMHKHGAPLGAEPSGHIIWAPHAWCADGLASALLLLRLLQNHPQSLLERIAQIPLLPRAQGRLNVTSRTPWSPELTADLEALHASLRPHGRLYLRYSGTQPLLRLLVEASTEEEAQETLHQALNLIQYKTLRK